MIVTVLTFTKCLLEQRLRKPLVCCSPSPFLSFSSSPSFHFYGLLLIQPSLPLSDSLCLSVSLSVCFLWESVYTVPAHAWYTYVDTCTLCADSLEEVTVWLLVSSIAPHLVFWDRFSRWAWNTMIQLAALASKPHRFSCLHSHLTNGLLCRFCWSDSAELGSSGLHSKIFTHWVVASGPNRSVLFLLYNHPFPVIGHFSPACVFPNTQQLFPK